MHSRGLCNNNKHITEWTPGKVKKKEKSTGNWLSTGTGNFLSTETGIFLITGTYILLSTDNGTTLLDTDSGTIILGTDYYTGTDSGTTLLGTGSSNIYLLYSLSVRAINKNSKNKCHIALAPVR